MFPHSRQIRLSERQAELLRELAERWDCQQVDVIRRLIVEAGAREGLTPAAAPAEPRPPLTAEERAARANAALGALAHVPGSVDEFLRRKQEEIDLEEEIWERRRAGRTP
jgi:hypothetical protein